MVLEEMEKIDWTLWRVKKVEVGAVGVDSTLEMQEEKRRVEVESWGWGEGGRGRLGYLKRWFGRKLNLNFGFGRTYLVYAL